MMYVTEEQVRYSLSVQECIEVLRAAFAMDFVNIPRYRLKSSGSFLHVMSSAIPALGVMGLKSYVTSRHAATFVVLLYDASSTELKAVLEADALGQIRTGAASGLATDLLSRPDSKIGAVIGTGYQAETQLLAIDAVRNFQEIRVYSRNSEKRKAFVDRLSSVTRAQLVAVGCAEEAIREADVICTITTSKDPVLQGNWLKPGCHINAVGSNWATKKELDEMAVRRSDLICVDHLEQSKIESGDLIGVVNWDSVVELSDVVRGKRGRSSEKQITLFKSNGIAMEDIAAADFVVRRLQKPV